ncbi:hypothetical protein SteCoe_37665 [Stentor coeruleus]|uniref:F-box domain-containing protein n=1 Tax=Stentor coeruleus TaxID=5963 RepID=A0A1R2AML9_9CILI|nr:hypothetical protein SteCoe_37665 [Stentor coeruleus]
MDQLPTVLYDDIFVFLEVGEVFGSLIHVCKSFKCTIESSHFLNIHLKWILRLDSIKWVRKENALKLLKDLIKKKKKKRTSDFLEFIPYSTDGGIDEDQECFWFGNGFENNSNTWCTLEGLLNVNASAVLAKTQVVTGYHLANQELIRIVRSWHERKGNVFSKRAEKNAAVIFNQVISSIPLNTLAAEEPDPESFKLIIREIISNLRPFKSGIVKSRRFPDQNNVLDLPFDRDSAENSSFYAVISRIAVSRKGNYTCPVKTLMVFVSHTYIDILDSMLKIYNDMKEYENLKQVHYYFPSSAKPREKIIEPGVEYCEFGWTKEILKPVLWVNFLENNRITQRKFKLKEEVSAKYLYVKLICPEDQREAQRWNHENMNIDCKYVFPEGRIIILE